MHFSSRYQSRQPIATVNIAGSVIKTSVSAIDPRVTLDHYLTTSTHVIIISAVNLHPLP